MAITRYQILNELSKKKKWLICLIVAFLLLGLALGFYQQRKTAAAVPPKQQGQDQTVLTETEQNERKRANLNYSLEQLDQNYAKSYFNQAESKDIFQGNALLKINLASSDKENFAVELNSVGKYYQRMSRFELDLPGKNDPDQFWKSFLVKHLDDTNLLTVHYVGIDQDQMPELFRVYFERVTELAKQDGLAEHELKLLRHDITPVSDLWGKKIVTDYQNSRNEIKKEIDATEVRLAQLKNKNQVTEPGGSGKLKELFKYVVLGLVLGLAAAVAFLFFGASSEDELSRMMSKLKQQEIPILGTLIEADSSALAKHLKLIYGITLSADERENTFDLLRSLQAQYQDPCGLLVREDTLDPKFRQLLSERKIQVSTWHSLAEGIEKFEKAEFRLLLLSLSDGADSSVEKLIQWSELTQKKINGVVLIQ